MFRWFEYESDVQENVMGQEGISIAMMAMGNALKVRITFASVNTFQVWDMLSSVMRRHGGRKPIKLGYTSDDPGHVEMLGHTVARLATEMTRPS